MAFSDLCKISNAYKAVENEPDQSERIMEENAMVRDLITKILDETGPSETCSIPQPPDKPSSLNHPSTLQYQKNETNTFAPPYNYQDNMYNYPQNDQNSFNFLPNGYGNTNGFNFNDDVNLLLGMDTIGDASNEAVTPEQLNLLRLAAQEIGGAQFTNPNTKFDYNFFETNQRNAMQENNIFQNNFNRNSVNMENIGYNNTNVLDPYQNNMQRFQNGRPEPNEMMNFLNPMNSERPPDNNIMQNNMADYNKMQMDMNGHYQGPEEERNKLYNYNRNYPQKQCNNDNFYMNDIMKNPNEKNGLNYPQKFEYNQQVPNFKPNGFHQMENLRRDMNQPPPSFQGNMNEQRPNFDNNLNQQAIMLRQNQELARQMALLMRNRPPPNQLNVDVSFLHENAPFNLGIGGLIGPSPPVPPQVLPSPMLDLPLLAPFYAMRNMRTNHSSSAILHLRLDACYEQWRQLERERKRTEARLALAYPGRAVSSSNSIPVPRLPPCPTRVDRLTVDMLREHTKVLTLMGKMETLRASVCVAQNKKPKEDKITVLKRGQDKDDKGIEPDKFDPASWRDDVKNIAEIAPHAEVESAMLSWRSAVGAVQAARRRELSHPHTDLSTTDRTLGLAEAVKQLCVSARRARAAMWCDLTLTVALAPNHTPEKPQSSQSAQNKQASPDTSTNTANGKSAVNNKHSNDKEEKATTDAQKKPDQKTTEPNNNKQQATTTKNDKQEQKNNQQRRTQNYNRHKLNQIGKNDFYQKNQRYDNRFMPNRHPYYLATGPIN